MLRHYTEGSPGKTKSGVHGGERRFFGVVVGQLEIEAQAELHAARRVRTGYVQER